MADNMLRAYRTPSLESLDAGSIIGQYRVGMNDAINEQKRNLLRQVGGAAASGDLDAAAKVAMAGGDIDTGLNLQNTALGRQKTSQDMSLDQQKRAFDFLTRAASAADTPEKWAQLNQLLTTHFGPDSVKGFEDFAKRDMAIALSMSASEKAEMALKQQTLDKKSVSGIPNDVEERRRAVESQGLDPKSPNMQSFILSGRMPREDQQPLSATDKKAVMEADDSVLAATTAIEALSRAKEVSKKAYSGPLAGHRGYFTSLAGAEGGEATKELENIVTTNALSQLKAIFGGAPTEGERKILLDIQGSVNESNEVRQKIYDRAIVAARRRLDFNKQRADELRGGTYYKSDGQQPTKQPTAVPDPLGIRGGP